MIVNHLSMWHLAIQLATAACGYRCSTTSTDTSLSRQFLRSALRELGHLRIKALHHLTSLLHYRGWSCWPSPRPSRRSTDGRRSLARQVALRCFSTELDWLLQCVFYVPVISRPTGEVHVFTVPRPKPHTMRNAESAAVEPRRPHTQSLLPHFHNGERRRSLLISHMCTSSCFLWSRINRDRGWWSEWRWRCHAAFVTQPRTRLPCESPRGQRVI
jgi:hypothetical protein